MDNLGKGKLEESSKRKTTLLLLPECNLVFFFFKVVSVLLKAYSFSENLN